MRESCRAAAPERRKALLIWAFRRTIGRTARAASDLLVVVGHFPIRIELVGTRAVLGCHLPRIARLLLLLAGYPLALLGLLKPGLRFLTKLLRLFPPLRLLAAAHHPEPDQAENEQRADRNHDPYPSCHDGLLRFSRAPSVDHRQTGGASVRFRPP